MRLKYVDTAVTFAEVPDEITLCINISNCPCACIGCHSPYLAEDIGNELTTESLSTLINGNAGITCVAFMGGDVDYNKVLKLAKYVKENYDLKTAWYSGKDELPRMEKLVNLDYVKIGHYDSKFGPLDSATTNQRMYQLISAFGSCDLLAKSINYRFVKS